MTISKIKLQKKGKLALVVCAIIIYVVLNVFWIQTSKVVPLADQREVHQIAEKIVNGQMDELKQSKYLQLNPQQIGTSYFIATIYTVFHSTNYAIIQYLNVICNVVSIITLYLIIKHFFKEYAFNKYIYFMISLTFIPFILLSTFVYGDYIGLMLSILAIYTIMKYTQTRKMRFLMISAILMAISYIIKSNYLIFILAFIIYLILDWIEQKNWKDIIAIILFILITLFPNTILKNVIANQLDINHSKSIPTSAYIYMGMNEGTRANGWYNATMDYAWNDIDSAYTYYPEKIKERVTQLIKNPIYTFKFYAKKTISMWSEVTYGSIWYNLPFQASNHDEFLGLMGENIIFSSICQGKLNLIFILYQKALVLLIFFGAAIAIWKNRRTMSLNVILLITIFLGGFFFHVIWEAKSRYILPYVFILIPISVIGIESVMNYLWSHINRRKKKLKEKEEHV